MIQSASPSLRPPERKAPSVGFYRVIYATLAIISIGAIVSGFAYYLLGAGPFWGAWEDSFMLVRYADNLLHGSGLIWNPGGRATYGLTSVFYIVPVAVIQAILPHKPILTIPLTSFLCGCLFLVLTWYLLRPFLRGNRAAQAALTLIFLISSARASTALAAHFFSGMDTMFDLSMLTGYVLIARWLERSKKWIAAVALGLAGGLMYGVRPDLLIYTFVIPSGLVILSRDRALRIRGAVAFVVTVCTLLLFLLGAYIYFGTPLPLPFYAKGLKLYGDFEYERYRQVPWQQFQDYASSYALVFLVIVFDLVDSIRNRRQFARSPLEVGLLGGTLFFIVYYLFFVLQIMEFNSRFYYPTLPALLFLSAAGIRRLVEKYAQRVIVLFSGRNALRWAAELGILGLVLSGPALAVNGYHALRAARGGLVTWDQSEEYRKYWSDYWFRLDRFSALPSDLVMATTEIGHVAAMNPGKVVVDMAGLNEFQFAKKPFSAQVLLTEFHPDLIYMPHPGYRSMNRDLLINPIFIRNYEYIPASKFGPTFKFGIALRRDSKYFPQMQAIVDARS